MSFSYRDEGEGIPIAKEVHGRKIVYLNPLDPDAPSCHQHNDNSQPSECVKCGKQFKSLTGYRYHIKKVCQDNQFEFRTTNEITPLPLQSREVIYSAGSQGSGKTFRLASYIYYWLKMNPNRPVMMISRLEYDETFNMEGHDGFGNLEKHIQRMKPELSWLENKFKLEEFQDCLLCFDDITCSTWSDNPDYKEQAKENKAIQAYLEEFLLDAISNGRHFNIQIFVTNHDLYSKGQGIAKVLKDVTSVYVFPQTASDHHLTYFLHEYCGLNKTKIDEIKASQSRWVLLHLHSPRYYMTDHLIKRYDLIMPTGTEIKSPQ